MNECFKWSAELFCGCETASMTCKWLQEKSKGQRLPALVKRWLFALCFPRGPCPIWETEVRVAMCLRNVSHQVYRLPPDSCENCCLILERQPFPGKVLFLVEWKFQWLRINATPPTGIPKLPVTVILGGRWASILPSLLERPGDRQQKAKVVIAEPEAPRSFLTVV